MSRSERPPTEWKKGPLDPELAALVNRKTRGHTVFGKKWLQKARHNAEKTKWGEEIAKRILDAADYWVSKDAMDLLKLVPTGNPRASVPGAFYGDPLTGGNRGTLHTCLETPYRWYNKDTKMWWYVGAKVKNPGTGKETIVEDDGGGFVSPEGFPHPGERTMFTAAYRLYLIGFLVGEPYPGALGPDIVPESTELRYVGAVPHMAEAYTLTGDRRYAYKAAVLIGRLAELYSYMNGTRGDGGFASDTHWGEVSCTEYPWVMSFVDAVDLIYDAVDEEMDRQLVELFGNVPGPEGRERREPFNWKDAIHEWMVYAAQCSDTEHRTDADWKLCWLKAEMTIAACTESPKLMARAIFDNPHNLRGTLINSFYRDGRHLYDSIAYIWCMVREFLGLPLRTVGFQGGKEFPEPLNLYTDQRFPIDRVIALAFAMDTGRITPTFGDSGDCGNPEVIPEERLAGLPRYDDNGGIEVAAAFSAEIYHLFKQRMSRRTAGELESLRAEHGDFATLAFALPISELTTGPPASRPLSSALLEDSPISFLRSGGSYATRHDLVLYGQPTDPWHDDKGQRYGGHSHGDKLGIWFGGRGRHLAANGGSYPFTWAMGVGCKLTEWEAHSAACWVVLVDGKIQLPSHSNLIAHYEGELFKLSAMENQTAYPGSHYERKALLVPGIVDGDAYVVDIFRVSNGKLFDYNTRGNDAGGSLDGNGTGTRDEVAFDFGQAKAAWKKRKGSLAGENVPLYSQPGYGWMKDVKVTQTDKDFSWTYDYGGASLKVHAMAYGRKREVIRALGELGGQERGRSPWHPHVLWRDRGDKRDAHETQFVTALESIGGKPFLKRVSAMKCGQRDGFHPVGLVIEHENGYTDIIMVCDKAKGTVSFTDSHGRVWSTDAHIAMQRIGPDGAVLATEIFDGTILTTPLGDHSASPACEGKVESVDYVKRTITVLLDKSPEVKSEDLNGLVSIIMPTGGGRVSPYRIHEAKLKGRQLLFTSGMSLIHADPAEVSYTLKSAATASRPTHRVAGKDVIVDVVPGDRFRLALQKRG